MFVINEIVDIAFFADILIVFRTSFYDAKIGGENSNAKAIAKRYMMKQFYIDFLAMVPFDQISSVNFRRNP